MMKKPILICLLILIITIVGVSCEQDLELFYEREKEGTVVLKFFIQEDTLQFVTQGDTLADLEPVYNDDGAIVDYRGPNYFIRNKTVSKSFALSEGESETLQVIRRNTGEVLATYKASFAQPMPDTLSFFAYREEIFIEGVLDFEPDTLSAEVNTGFQFIFPEPNFYSNSGYDGELEAVLLRLSGEEIGRVAIGKEKPGSFIEFPASNPPLVEIQIVKAGTDEEYVKLETLISNAQEGESYLYVFYELKDEETDEFDGVGYFDLKEFVEFE